MHGFHDEGPSTPDQQAIWQLIANFEDISFSRPQLLEQAGQFLHSYPDSQYAARAREIVERLKTMISEDAAHTNLTDQQWNFRFSHNVMAVGDCALAILQKMSGTPFYTRQTTSSYMSGDGNVAEIKAAARAW